MLKELKALFKKNCRHFDLDKHTTLCTPLMAVNLVRQHIEKVTAAIERAKEDLILQRQLGDLDKRLKAEFDDCFPADLPHIRDIPE
ncbi:hypothetical protein H0H92_002558, partial [Tricholoma furcatifolium]